jgi:hypothetical protein
MLVGVGCGESQPRVACGAKGTETDISSEPDYSAKEDFQRWTNSDGCPVRLDVLSVLVGPEHCGWQSARTLRMGARLGQPWGVGVRSYISDPNGLFTNRRLSKALDRDATLPSRAADTGYRRGKTKLWMVPGDDEYVYLVGEEVTQRWPLARPSDKVGLCA